jgi:hypothetical protein
VREQRRREQPEEALASPAARRGPDPNIDLVLAMQSGHGNAHVSRMLARRTHKTAAPPVAETMMVAADTAEAGDVEASVPRYRAATLDDEYLRLRGRADELRANQRTLELALEAKAKPGEVKRDGLVVEALLVKPEMKPDNERAIRGLDRVVDSAADNAGMVRAFQSQLGNLDRDHARLITQLSTYGKTKRGAGTFTRPARTGFIDTGEGEKLGEREVASTGVKDGEFRAASTGKDNPVAAHQGRAEAAGREMRTKSASIGTLYGEFRAQQDKVRSRLYAIDRIAAETSIENAQDKIAKLKDRSSTTRDVLSQIGGLVSNVLGFSGWANEPNAQGGVSGDARAAGGNIFTGAMMLAFDLVNREENKKLDAQIQALETELVGLKAAKQDNAADEALAALRAEKQLLVVAANKCVNAQGELERAQHDYRQSMSDMGASADQTTGKGRDRFEVLAQLLSEADAWDAQARVAADVGEQYLRDTATLPEGESIPVKYWKMTTYARSKLILVGGQQPIEDAVSVWKQASVRREIKGAVKALKAQREEIGALASELRGAFESRGGKL